MRKFSEIDSLDISPINEGALRDFFKLTKDKYFSDTYFLSPEDFNDVKYKFADSLLNLCKKKLKFKSFTKNSLSKLMFSPDKVLSQMVDDLKGVLEKQKTSKSRVNGLSSFNFNVYYNENKKESLLNHCIHITKDIQEYFLKQYILTLEIVYNIDYKKDLEDYVKYKEMSLELFKTAFEIKEKKWNFSLSAFTPKSKYEKLAKDILDNFKYQGLDVEYTFIGDPKVYKSNVEIERPETMPSKKPNVVSDNTLQAVTTTNFAKKDATSKQGEVTVQVDKKENIEPKENTQTIQPTTNIKEIQSHPNYSKIITKIIDKVNLKVKETPGYSDFNLVAYSRNNKLPIETVKQIVDDNLYSSLVDVSKVYKISIDNILDTVKFIDDRIDWGQLNITLDEIIDSVVDEIIPYIKR
jgi:hypothetical protein